MPHLPSHCPTQARTAIFAWNSLCVILHAVGAPLPGALPSALPFFSPFCQLILKQPLASKDSPKSVSVFDSRSHLLPYDDHAVINLAIIMHWLCITIYNIRKLVSYRHAHCIGFRYEQGASGSMQQAHASRRFFLDCGNITLRRKSENE